METLHHEVLSNVGWAAALAMGAALAGLTFRHRPALIHGLWVLVLLKLVTPSLLHLTPTWADGQTTLKCDAPTRFRLSSREQPFSSSLLRRCWSRPGRWRCGLSWTRQEDAIT